MPKKIKRHPGASRRLAPSRAAVVDDVFKRYLEEHDLDEDDDEEMRQRIELMSGEGEPIIDTPADEGNDDELPDLDLD